MPLQRGSNGLISRNLAGQLACSPLDCCETPPCPDCCVEITSGAFIDGAIKIFSFDGDNTLEITITTPSGTRYVCEDDIITIAMVYLVDGVETASPISPFVIFDPAWELTAHDPPADLTQTKPGGWVYWESEVESEFSVSLKFNGCYFNNISDLGAITIDFPGIEEVIAIERCNILSDCCRMVAECEPCCLLLDPVDDFVNPLVWSWNAELLRFERLSYAFNGDIAYWILLWIEPEPGEDVEDYAQWCLDGVWEFGISIGPANIESEVQLSGIKTAVRVEACDFDVSGDPTPDPVTVTDVTELVIEWNIEDGLGRMEYEWALIRDCAHPGCSAIGIQIEFDHPTLELTLAEPLGIELFSCPPLEGEDCCECCCHCYLENATVTDLDITSGGTTWRLTAPVSLAVPEGGTCFWILGIYEEGNPANTGSVGLTFCNESDGWTLQDPAGGGGWIDQTATGECTGEIFVTKPGVTGSITIEGGADCPEI